MAYAVSYFPDGTRSLPYTQLIAKYAVDDRLTWMGRINAADTPVEHHDFPIAFCRPDDQQDEAARPAAGGGGGGGGGGGQAGGDAAAAVGSNRALTLSLHERTGAEASEPAAMRAMFEPALHRPSGAVAGAPIPSKPKRASKDEE